jgi:hypothetical protein
MFRHGQSVDHLIGSLGRGCETHQLLDHEHVMAIAIWQRQTEDGLRKKIPDNKLNPLEKALRDLQLNFHPATVRASAVDAPCGAV